MGAELSRHSACRRMVAAWAAVCGALVVAWGVTAVAQQVDAPAAGAAAEINAAFLDPDLDVAEWVTRFEGESREVFTSRRAILAAMQVQPGEAAADVGAGTGLYTALLAGAVGPRGWVYAVDIAPRFVAHIAERAAAAGLGNVTPVVCTAASVQLPPECVDLVFICDTYHHFEHPAQTLASIHAALRPGGRLAVVDFERIEGVSREWVLDHVRAGKGEVTAEIESAGFRLTAEPRVPGLEENYMLIFTKE